MCAVNLGYGANGVPRLVEYLLLRLFPGLIDQQDPDRPNCGQCTDTYSLVSNKANSITPASLNVEAGGECRVGARGTLLFVAADVCILLAVMEIRIWPNDQPGVETRPEVREKTRAAPSTPQPKLAGQVRIIRSSTWTPGVPKKYSLNTCSAASHGNSTPEYRPLANVPKPRSCISPTRTREVSLGAEQAVLVAQPAPSRVFWKLLFGYRCL